MSGKPKYYVRMKTKRHKKVKVDDTIQLFQQLSTLINSGTPILQALNLSSIQSESESLSNITKELAKELSRGSSLYQAMSKYPNVFEGHWVHMVRVGELTGKLGLIFTELQVFLEKQKALKSKIVSALTYPIILIFVAIGSVTVMLWKVIPTFAAFFDDMGGELPAITQYVLSMSDFVQAHGLKILALCVVSWFALRKYMKTPQGRDVFSRLFLATPGIGDFLVLSVMERFGSNLGLLLKSGTPLLEGIEAVKEMFVNNTVYYDTFGDVLDSVARGNSLAQSMESTQLFTPLVTNMVKIGEESGRLPDVLEEVAKFYATKVENQLLTITGGMEPIIVIGMGITVALLLGSVYMPMFQMSAGGG